MAAGVLAAARRVRVIEKRSFTADVTHFRCAPVDETAPVLARYQPGSHRVVTIRAPGGGRRCAYSLVDDGQLPPTCGISVPRRSAARRGRRVARGHMGRQPLGTHACAYGTASLLAALRELAAPAGRPLCAGVVRAFRHVATRSRQGRALPRRPPDIGVDL